jgi:hypothetical protein
MRRIPDHLDPRFLARDRERFVRPGLFPVTDIPVLEQLRGEHEALLVQRDEYQQAYAALARSFEAEDEAHERALDEALRQPGAERAQDKRTSHEERVRRLAEIEAHVHAASRVLITFGMDAVDRMRGELPEDWDARVAGNAQQVPPNGEAAAIATLLDTLAADAQAKANEASRALAEAKRTVAETVPLRWWLSRFANAGVTGGTHVEPGADLDVPTAYTVFTKPMGEPDPPGWPRQMAADEGVEVPIDGDQSIDSPPTDDLVEDRMVDQSDPWFAEQEATS